MVQKKQAGFTLIELIIVIVILGILAVTASPKFLDLQGDARASAVQGMAAAVKGATNITYSKSLVRGVASSANQGADFDDDGTAELDLDFGYPEANDRATWLILLGLDDDDDASNGGTGDQAAGTDLDGVEWEYDAGTVDGVDAMRIFPVGDYADGGNGFSGDELNCYVQYVMDDSSSTATPQITVVDDGC